MAGNDTPVKRTPSRWHAAQLAPKLGIPYDDPRFEVMVSVWASLPGGDSAAVHESWTRHFGFIARRKDAMMRADDGDCYSVAPPVVRS